MARIKDPRGISSIEFDVGGHFEGTKKLVFTATGEGADVIVKHYPIEENDVEKEFHITQKRWQNLIDKLIYQLHVTEGEEDYFNPYILDGTQWCLTIKKGRYKLFECHGSNEYPPYWDELVRVLSYYSETNLY